MCYSLFEEFSIGAAIHEVGLLRVEVQILRSKSKRHQFSHRSLIDSFEICTKEVHRDVSTKLEEMGQKQHDVGDKGTKLGAGVMIELLRPSTPTQMTTYL